MRILSSINCELMDKPVRKISQIRPALFEDEPTRRSLDLEFLEAGDPIAGDFGAIVALAPKKLKDD